MFLGSGAYPRKVFQGLGPERRKYCTGNWVRVIGNSGQDQGVQLHSKPWSSSLLSPTRKSRVSASLEHAVLQQAALHRLALRSFSGASAPDSSLPRFSTTGYSRGLTFLGPLVSRALTPLKEVDQRPDPWPVNRGASTPSSTFRLQANTRCF